MKKIAVFASGSGTNFQAVIDAIKKGQIRAEISGLLASKDGIEAIIRAKKSSIPVYILTDEERFIPHKYLETLNAILDKWDPDLIVLAGYLKKIPPEIIGKYENKIINIHPSLLPKYGGKGYYGLKVHEAVIENHETESGCSVHIVTTEYDQGPVLDRIIVPVYPGDTPEVLQKRVLTQEHLLLPRVIKQILNN